MGVVEISCEDLTGFQVLWEEFGCLWLCSVGIYMASVRLMWLKSAASLWQGDLSRFLDYSIFDKI